MVDEQRCASDPLQALRQDAIAICRRAGWSPRRLGQEGGEPGVSEIYEELRCLQKVLAVDVAQELIDCCRRHQQWSPLFEDVEARIALFRGEVAQAEQIWTRLLNHPSPIVQRIAQKALVSLGMKRDSGEQLVTDVLQALDRNHLKRVESILLDALMAAKDLGDPKLTDALESFAMARSSPEHWPWNQALLIDQVVLDLFDQQLSTFEAYVG